MILVVVGLLLGAAGLVGAWAINAPLRTLSPATLEMPTTTWAWPARPHKALASWSPVSWLDEVEQAARCVIRCKVLWSAAERIE
jgi:hypothetical protein